MKRELFLSLVLAGLPFHALAHGDGHANRQVTKMASGPVEETPFGQAGDPAKVTRTIRIEMSDKMRFAPDAVTVKRGETVKFVVRNSGKVLHEMVLGTKEHLEAHHELMKKFPGMEHDEPHQAHVDPGKRGEIVWQFTKAGEFHYGCLIPGHFEAGMIGKVTVK